MRFYILFLLFFSSIQLTANSPVLDIGKQFIFYFKYKKSKKGLKVFRKQYKKLVKQSNKAIKKGTCKTLNDDLNSFILELEEVKEKRIDEVGYEKLETDEIWEQLEVLRIKARALLNFLACSCLHENGAISIREVEIAKRELKLQSSSVFQSDDNTEVIRLGHKKSKKVAYFVYNKSNFSYNYFSVNYKNPALIKDIFQVSAGIDCKGTYCFRQFKSVGQNLNINKVLLEKKEEEPCDKLPYKTVY